MKNAGIPMQAVILVKQARRCPPRKPNHPSDHFSVFQSHYGQSNEVGVTLQVLFGFYLRVI